MAIDIRLASISDAPKIAQVHISSRNNVLKSIISNFNEHDVSLTNTTKSWEEIISNSTFNHVFIATVDEKIVGVIRSGPPRAFTDIYSTEIWAFYVLPEFQNQGIGYMLFSQMIKRLKKDGHTNAVLWALKENPHLNFYYQLDPDIVGGDLKNFSGIIKDRVALGWDLDKLEERIQKQKG